MLLTSGSFVPSIVRVLPDALRLELNVGEHGCPQWTDKGTNAKLIEDVWKPGVRVTVNNEGIVERDEINRCLDLVMGDGDSK
ncbi:hypothetical protein DITRI_Ditri17bG0030400 [Diplodiscus trichospermus]